MSYANVIAAAAAIGSTIYASENAPKPAGQSNVVKPQGGGGKPAENVFQANVPTAKTKPPSAVRADSDPFVSNLIGPLLANASPGAGQPAPITKEQAVLPGELAPIDTPGGTGAPAGGPNRANPNIADILGSVPEALAIAGPLLGIGQKDHRVSTQAVGAQGGGAGGNLVAGLQLPKRQSLGELLSALPRPRYG